ncbi:MAG: class I SAM-dependent methyltransferase [Bacteroidales bacterium]|nr:class I SAM-dependent methyltransferase [Bacteroidales bacterium]
MANYAVAKLYDLLLYPFLNKIRKKTAKIIIQLNPKSVIDICCGTGNQLEYLKNTDIKLTGIDLSPAMLKVAKHIDCYEQDARDIQFSDNSFDLVMIQLALHEKSFDDQKMIIDEASRITRNNGHLLIVDYEINEKTKPYSRYVINAIEFLAGKEHFKNFKEYHKNECTNKLISNNVFLLEKKVLIAGKSMALQIYRKTNN